MPMKRTTSKRRTESWRMRLGVGAKVLPHEGDPPPPVRGRPAQERTNLHGAHVLLLPVDDNDLGRGGSLGGGSASAATSDCPWGRTGWWWTARGAPSRGCIRSKILIAVRFCTTMNQNPWGFSNEIENPGIPRIFKRQGYEFAKDEDSQSSLHEMHVLKIAIHDTFRPCVG